MIIKSVKVTSYGKLKEKTVDFKNGVNIIYGKNEAGKTTLMSFIKGMLYGFNGKGTGIKNERKKYLPWDGGTIAGEIKLEKDNGNDIVISRTCGKTAATDKSTVIDLASGEKSEFSAESEIGFGEEAFLKTLFIRQLGSLISGENDEITAKLVNLSSGGDEEMGFHKAVSILETAIRGYKHKRGDGGHINDLKRRIMQLREELDREERFETECILEEKRCRELEKAVLKNAHLSSETEKEIEKTKNLLSLVKIKKEKDDYINIKKRLEKKREELEAVEALFEKYNAFSTNISEKVFEPCEDISAIEMEKLTISKTLKVMKTVSLVSVLGSMATLAAGALISVFFLISATLFIVGALFYFLGKEKNKRIDALSDKIKKITKQNEDKLEELKKYDCTSLKEYMDKKAEHSALKAKKSSVESEYVELLKEFEAIGPKEQWNDVSDDIIPVSEEELDNLQTKYSSLLAQGGELKKELATLQLRLETANEGHRVSSQIREELYSLNEELKENEENLEALNVALDTINEAYLKISKTFAPKLNSYASEMMRNITDDEHSGFVVDKQYNIVMETGGFKELEYFSSGTVEQAYLSLRLALAKMLSGDKKLPVFLDDSFVLYDDERETKAMKIVEEYAKDAQVFLFTCKKKYTENNNYNIVKL